MVEYGLSYSYRFGVGESWMNKQPTGEQWSVFFQPEVVGLLNRRRAGGTGRWDNGYSDSFGEMARRGHSGEEPSARLQTAGELNDEKKHR